MRRVLYTAIVVIAGAILGCVVAAPPPEPSLAPPPPPPAREPARRVECTPPHRMAILDLDVVPDPVVQGQPIQGWRITLRSDRNGECGTLLEVRDQDQIAGAGERQVIRPGRGSYTISAAPGYRFQRRDPCFVVQVNVGGTFTPVDAQRTFCARQMRGAGWTLRGR